ncbi:MAG TPA: hypothetical protein VIB08_04085 [Thermoanaerobaculia bacterium]
MRRRVIGLFLGVCVVLVSPVDVSRAQDAEPQPSKPALYSLPWLLRPAIPGSVVRIDETIAFYEDPASGTAGTTYVTSFIASYKVSPELAIIFREAWVSNSAPAGGSDPSGSAFSNGALGANYSRAFGKGWRWTAFLGSNIPWGSGGGDSPDPGDAAALTAANAARSQMEGSIFAVNYWTVILGGDLTYVSPAVSLQAEVTFFQLTRVRGPESQDSSRTNLTAGLHAAHFFSPQVSVGTEFRIQRWLSNASAVVSDPSARQQFSWGIGPRFHFKVGEKGWFRPGVSYSRYLDDPLSAKDYNILQVDLPFAF